MPEGVPVGVLHVVNEGRVVQVGVEVHDVQWLREGANHGIGNGVIATQHERHGTAIQDTAHHGGDVVERALHVGGQNIGVADIGDAPVGKLILEELFLEFWIIEPFSRTGEPEGMLSDRPGSETRARHERRAFVERDAHHRDLRLQPIEVLAVFHAQEGGNADERHVQAFGMFTIHDVASCLDNQPLFGVENTE